MTLEETLSDLAKRGEITDLGLTPNRNGTFHAVYAPASTFGIGMADHADPVQAILMAIGAVKLRKRAAFKDGDGARIRQADVEVPAEDVTGPAPAPPEDDDPAADLM